MSWNISPVSEFCTLVIDCVNKTAPLSEVETPYKMLRTTNIKGGFIDFDSVRYVEKDVFIRWTRRGKPIYGDVLFTREAPVGEVGRFTSKSENYFLGQRTFLYRANPEKLDWNYLAYVLQSPQIQGWVNGIAYGATVPHLKVGDMEQLKIPIPPLSIQKKIAKILSNYDDLIENNFKRITLLEESAKLTYEEWFLRFRIDGKKLDIDPTTSLPFEWRDVQLIDFIDLLKGVEPGSSHYEEEKTDSNIPFFRVGDLSKQRSNVYISIDYTDNKTTLKDDILLSLDGSPGKVKFGFEGCYSTGIRKAVSKKDNISNVFIFNLLNSQYIQSLISAYATGTTILHAGSSVKKMRLVLPKDEVLDKYNDVESKKFQLILNLLDQNELLEEARNILLPRLMTGMIDTDDLGIAL